MKINSFLNDVVSTFSNVDVNSVLLKNEELRSRIMRNSEKFKKELNASQLKLSESENARRRAETQIVMLKKSLGELRTKLSEESKKGILYNKLLKKHESLQTKLQEKTKKAILCEKLEKKYEVAQSRLSENKDRNKALESRIKRLNGSVNDLQTKLSEKSVSYEELRKKHETVQTSLTESNVMNRTLESQITKLNKSANDLQTKLTKETTKYKALGKKYNIAQEELSKRKEDNKNLEAQVDKLNESIKDLEARLLEEVKTSEELKKKYELTQNETSDVADDETGVTSQEDKEDANIVETGNLELGNDGTGEEVGFMGEESKEETESGGQDEEKTAPFDTEELDAKETAKNKSEEAGGDIKDSKANEPSGDLDGEHKKGDDEPEDNEIAVNEPEKIEVKNKSADIEEQNEPGDEAEEEEGDPEEDTFYRNFKFNNIDNLMPALQLSLPEVYDVKEGILYTSRWFLTEFEENLIDWRRTLREAYSIKQPRLICPECRQMVRLNGRKTQRGKICYFAHYQELGDCTYKTTNNRTEKQIEIQKYGLVQEFEIHKKLIEQIRQSLCGETSKEIGVKDVECQKNITKKIPYLKQRRPDICANLNGRSLVFELQLGSTFVDVIVERDIFYRLNNYDVIWVFNFDNEKDGYEKLRNLMSRDIYYANKRNVFIFDKGAQELSEQQGQLVLKCRWLDENDKWSQDEIITLADLQYDDEYNKPYIYDADADYFRIHPGALESRRKIENKKQDLLNAILKKEEIIDKRIAYIIEQLKKSDESVEPFMEKTKYGFKYNEEIIVPAKYTSVKKLESGYFEVGFRTKIGLVNRLGTEIAPVEYWKTIIVNSEYEIVLAYSYRGCIDLYIHGIKTHLMDRHSGEIVHSRVYDFEKIDKFPKDNVEATEYYISHDTYGSYHSRGRRSRPNQNLFNCLVFSEYILIDISEGKNLIVTHNGMFEGGDLVDLKPVGENDLYIAKDTSKGCCGIIDANGNSVFDFVYKELKSTKSKYVLYASEELWGIMDCYGYKYADCFARDLRYLGNDYFAYSNSEKWGVSDKFGKTICEEKFTYIKLNDDLNISVSISSIDAHNWNSNDGLAQYRSSYAAYELLSTISGEIIYNDVILGDYKVRTSGKLCSLLTIDNKVLLNYECLAISRIYGDVFLVRTIAGLYGGISYHIYCADTNTMGKNYNSIKHLYADCFIYEQYRNSCAIGNSKGPLSDWYNDIKQIDDNHFIASNSIYVPDKYDRDREGTHRTELVIIDQTGNKLSENVFSQISEFENGVAEAMLEGENTRRTGKIDLNGNLLEEKVRNLPYNFALYLNFNLYYIKNADSEIVSPEFKSIESLTDEFYKVTLCGDNEGTSTSYYGVRMCRTYSVLRNKLSDNAFSSISAFDNGIADAVYNGKKGKIDLNGNLLEEKVRDLPDGHTLYVKFEKYYVKDANSKIISPIFDLMEPLTDDFYRVKQEGEDKYRTYCVLTNRLSTNAFKSISECNDGMMKAELDWRTRGIIDLHGNLLEKKIEDLPHDFALYLKFGHYYIKNSNSEIISPEFESISSLTDEFYKVKKVGESGYRAYSILANKLSDDSYNKDIVVLFDSFLLAESSYKAQILNGTDLVKYEKHPDGFDEVRAINNYYLGLRRYVQKTSSKNNYGYWGRMQPDRVIRWGVGTIKGDIVIDFILDDCPVFENDGFAAKIDGAKGTLDKEGNRLTVVKEENKNYRILEKFGKFRLEDAEENVLIDFEKGYSGIFRLTDEFVSISHRDEYARSNKGDLLFALFNSRGEKLTEFKYLSIEYKEDEDNFAVSIRNKWSEERRGRINKSGEIDDTKKISIYGNQYIIFEQFELYGLRKYSGEITIPREYNAIFVAKDNVVITRNESGCSLFTCDGKKLTDTTYDFIKMEDGQIIAGKKPYGTRTGQVGSLNIDGKESYQKEASGGYKIDFQFGKCSIISPDGKVVLNGRYSSIKELISGVFAIRGNNLYSLVQPEYINSLVVREESSYALANHESLLTGFGNKKLEYLTENFVVAQRLVSSGSYGGSSALKWGVYNVAGNIVIDFILDTRPSFKNDKFVSQINGTERRFDKNGNIEPIVIERGNNYRILESYKKFRLEDANGDVLIDFENDYSGIFKLTDEFISISVKNKFALFNAHGDQLTKFEYSSIKYNEEKDDFDVIRDNISGSINKTGAVVDENSLSVCDDKYVIFKAFGKYGLRTKEGVETLPYVFDRLFYTMNNIVVGKRDGSYSLFSCAGEKLTVTYYNEMIFHGGKITARRAGDSRVFDLNDTDYHDSVVSNGYIIRTQFDKYSLLSPTKEPVLTGEYSLIKELVEGVFAIKEGRYGHMALAKYDSFITRFAFKDLEFLTGNYVSALQSVAEETEVKKTGRGYKGRPYTYWGKKTLYRDKWGVLDTTGKVILPVNSDIKPQFSKGKITVQPELYRVSYTLEQLREKGK